MKMPIILDSDELLCLKTILSKYNTETSGESNRIVGILKELEKAEKGKSCNGNGLKVSDMIQLLVDIENEYGDLVTVKENETYGIYHADHLPYVKTVNPHDVYPKVKELSEKGDSVTVCVF